METEFRYKVVIVGDGGVGKSTLILQYTDRKFRETYIPTIGVQFTVKEVKYQGHLVEFVLWDIAGQEQFRLMRSSFYSGSNAAIIIFDIRDIVSFGNVINWYEELRRYRGDIPIFMLGNKIDLPERVITYETAQILAHNLNVNYYETSAKTGQNVIMVFNNLLDILTKRKSQKFPGTSADVPIQENPTEIFLILNELKEYIQKNGKLPKILDIVNNFSKMIFKQDPYSPILKEIAQLRLERFNNYPSKTINPQDKAELLLQIRKWEDLLVI
ncbi:MAG: Rab family GTPase [Promethearchaeota archaeon]